MKKQTQLSVLLEIRDLLKSAQPIATKEPVLEGDSLEAQYRSQVSLLEAVGITQNGTMTDIEGKKWPVPSLEEVKRRKASVETPFTRLLIVPQKMSLDTLIQIYGDVIGRHRKAGTLLDSEGNKIVGQPYEGRNVWTWNEYKNADVEGRLVYFPQKFSESHGGILKKDIVEGFYLIIIENEKNAPTTGKTPNELLKEGVSPLTPEAAIMDAVTRLEEEHTVTDGIGWSYQLGAYFPASGSVPFACWSRGNRLARLSGDGAGSRYGNYSARAGVRF